MELSAVANHGFHGATAALQNPSTGEAIKSAWPIDNLMLA
jgi:hypothetical protein